MAEVIQLIAMHLFVVAEDIGFFIACTIAMYRSTDIITSVEMDSPMDTNNM